MRCAVEWIKVGKATVTNHTETRPFTPFQKTKFSLSSASLYIANDRNVQIEERSKSERFKMEKCY